SARELTGNCTINFRAAIVERHDLDGADESVDQSMQPVRLEKISTIAKLGKRDRTDAEVGRSVLNDSFDDLSLPADGVADAIRVEHEPIAHRNGFFFLVIGC